MTDAPAMDTDFETNVSHSHILNQIAVTAANNPNLLNGMLAQSESPQGKALVLHNIGTQLLNQKLYDKAFCMLQKVIVSDLDSKHQEGFNYNLAALYTQIPDKIPGKTPQEVLKAAWDIVKEHKTSGVFFMERIRDHRAKELGKEAKAPLPKTWLSEMCSRNLNDILDVGDPAWGNLYCLLFAKLREPDYSNVLKTILKDISEGKPHKR